MPHFVRYSNTSDFDIECFNKRFGRNPKSWTIDQIHDLWERSVQRGNSRQKDLSNYIDRIVKEIPKNDRKEHVVYFYQDAPPSPNGPLQYIRSFVFTYHTNWRGYGWSICDVKLETRDERLTFILSNDKEFEMGKEFRRLDRLRTGLQHRVLSIMWNLVSDQLSKKFKNDYLSPGSIFTINISNKKYYVQVDERSHGYGYHKFNFMGECKEEEILIK